MNPMRLIQLAIALLSLINITAHAGGTSDARINIGLKLFRATLSADQQLTAKQKDHHLNLYILYKENHFKGQKYSRKLLDLGKVNGQAQIKNIPLNVSPVSYQKFLLQQHDIPAGIFLVDKMSARELQPVVAYAINNHLILYSPFEGDVEKNITAGLSIGARVQPVINMQTLKASAIQLKSFFLKVAHQYEP
ncbi:MAG: hypothetical protein KZQ83_16745 [gamma proteobacterium symbiont of Taylorina sp.]|nr:hypothetical protein [gamma proteobacterium symbiont of Taylorina sp.]